VAEENAFAITPAARDVPCMSNVTSNAPPNGRDPQGNLGPAASTHEGFAALVEGVTEYAVFLLDAQGRVLSWNRGAERTKGFPRADIVGQPIARLYMPADVAAGVPDVILRRAAQHGCDVTQGWRLRFDGSRFWAKVVTAALYDERGGVGGYLKIVNDETVHHAEEQKGATAIQWLRILTEACPVALLLVEGSDADRLWVNRRAAELLRELPGDLALDPKHERVSYPDGRPVPLEDRPLRRALRGKTAVESEEFLLCRPDGSTVPILGSAAPVLDGEGRVIGAVAAFDDISAIKQVERRREQWTAVVAHELRQPLSAIVTSVGRLASFRGSEERLFRATDIIVRSARRLDRIIRDLLDVASIECGKLHVDARPLDVEGHVRAAADRVAATVSDRHVLVEPRGTLPLTRADPERLDQILDNLLSNAVRYGAPGSDVTVTLDRAPDGVAVAVTNRGAGIPADQLPRLFEPFRREASTARVRESVGLGLYITKGLVVAHGGHIDATSTPCGETTFRFVLPAAA
jgi:PAS domain S-box-containing protein